MNKKLLILVAIILILVGCVNKEKFYLDDEYYQEGVITELTVDELQKLEKEEKSFMVFVYLPGCTSCAQFRGVLESYVTTNDLKFYSISINELKSSVILEHIEFAPSLVLYKEGKIIDALDAASDEDKDALTTETGLIKWLEEYIYLTD